MQDPFKYHSTTRVVNFNKVKEIPQNRRHFKMNRTEYSVNATFEQQVGLKNYYLLFAEIYHFFYKESVDYLPHVFFFNVLNIENQACLRYNKL